MDILIKMKRKRNLIIYICKKMVNHHIHINIHSLNITHIHLILYILINDYHNNKFNNSNQIMIINYHQIVKNILINKINMEKNYYQ